jgi:hypothetical protein
MYQCGTCEVKQQLDGLDAEGHQAWDIYQKVCSRFALETNTAGVVLDRATAGLDDDDALDVVARLSLLYGVLCPKKRLPSWRVN